MEHRSALTKKIFASGAIAVIRLKEELPLKAAVDALIRGGIRVLEVTLTTPNALSTIHELRKSFGEEILIGAGSVITEQQTRDVAAAGANFVISPITKKEVIYAGHANNLPVLPGALTPTEVQTAHEYGADMVKIFPAEQLGLSYIRALLAPLPHLKLVPTGGVTPENAGEWLRSGATAVGIGSALIDTEVLRTGQLSVLTERARILSTNITEARECI